MLYFNAYTYKGHLNLENRKHLEYLENPDFEYLHSLNPMVMRKMLIVTYYKIDYIYSGY